MWDLIEKGLEHNGLITAFAFVGIIMWVSVVLSKRLTFGRVHGSAIAIVIGLILAWVGGTLTGGQKGLADMALFSGIGLATAHARVEQLRRACASEVLVLDSESFGFEISAGVASFPHSADSLSALSQAAIRALNDARQRGGNRVALASIQLGGLTAR